MQERCLAAILQPSDARTAEQSLWHATLRDLGHVSGERCIHGMCLRARSSAPPERAQGRRWLHPAAEKSRWHEPRPPGDLMLRKPLRCPSPPLSPHAHACRAVSSAEQPQMPSSRFAQASRHAELPKSHPSVTSLSIRGRESNTWRSSAQTSSNSIFSDIEFPNIIRYSAK